MMATLSARAADESIEKLAQDPTCAHAIEWIDKNAAWVTDQQIRLTEIPAPEFKEARRGDALRKLFEANGLRVRVDKIGNVIGERPGSSSKDVVLLVAHLDTVFPTGTNVTVKRNASRLEAPGISDNGAGLAALIGVSRALSEGRVRTTKTLVFAGDVGEEGEGNLRGIRALVDEFGPRLSAVIAIDGPSIEHVTTQGIASRRFEVTITGPGRPQLVGFWRSESHHRAFARHCEILFGKGSGRPSQLLQFRRDRRRHFGEFDSFARDRENRSPIGRRIRTRST